MSTALEIEAIEQRYERRVVSAGVDLYAPTNSYVLMSEQEKDRVIVSLLKQAGIANRIGNCRLLEIGCGVGSNLVRFLRLGFSAENVVGNELLPARAKSAAQNLPSSVRLIAGDATSMDSREKPFDVVCLFTVMSSILDDDFQARLANKAWELTMPGGGVLWYDFVYNNPANRDVRAVPVARVKQLFPQANATIRRATLAPPIGRRVTPLWRGSYSLLNTIRPLRTHVLAWLAKTAH